MSLELEQFIDRQGFRFFKGAEFTPYWSRVRNGVKNSPPPSQLWVNILKTIEVLDEFRKRWGSPVKLLSTYRSPAYNRAVGGEKNSFHMRFRAIDFTSTRGTPKQWAAVLQAMRKEGIFRGGIGVYPKNGFVHVDTRGTNADW